MELSDRMKRYENLYQQQFCPLVPVIARLDGRAFHTFCNGMIKPFDKDFHDLMVQTTVYLVEASNAIVGYTQSDEISLLFYSDRFESQVFFDGKVMKMVSTLAAMASVKFNDMLVMGCSPVVERIHGGCTPVTFDCRAANYPVEEVANYFIWREQDAVRNSIQAAAQYYFSHKSIQNLNGKQLQEKLFQEKQINWNDYSYQQKRGTYVRIKKVSTPFTADEIESLPPKHHARTNPDLVVERRQVVLEEVPILTTIANRTEFLLYGFDPIKNT